jgi:hypothetical protein
MANYNVTPEFKTQTTEILNTKKFSAVFAYMNLVTREGYTYTEEELNSVVQFLGEFPYSEVNEFFKTLPQHVSPVTEPSSATPTTESPEQPIEATVEIEG